MSNPRNNQELLDKQFPSDEERQRRQDAINAYADSSIRRDKNRPWPVNDIGTRGDPHDGWIFGGGAQR